MTRLKVSPLMKRYLATESMIFLGKSRKQTQRNMNKFKNGNIGFNICFVWETGRTRY